MKIKNSEHNKRPWIAHTLLADFEVEDVWRFPVKLEENHSIHLFQKQLMEKMKEFEQKGIAGLLFKFRFFLGRIFGWDEKSEQPLNKIEKGSIRERYAKEYKLTVEQLPPPGNAEFIPVYKLEKETLSEIKNGTVHAALHLGKVPFKDSYTVQMAVYVKPKGTLGQFYMTLIKPFRLLIVYPAMMQMIKKQWQKYLDELG